MNQLVYSLAVCLALGLIDQSTLAAAQGTSASEATDDRLGLVSMSATLRESVRVALASWNVEILEVSAAETGTSMPESAEAAGQITAHHQLNTLVWITTNDSGAALWVFDAPSGHVAVRKLPTAPPYDDVAAASLALTIKTLLRHSSIAPNEERFGAQDPPLPVVAPTPVVATVTKTSAEVGAWVRARPGLAAEARLHLGVGHWLRPSTAAITELKIGLGRSVRRSSVVGRLSSFGLGLGARQRLLKRDQWSTSLFATAGLEWSRLTTTEPQDLRINRFNPTVSGSGRVGYQIRDAVALTLDINGRLSIRRQRYEVQGEPALEMPRADWGVGFGFELGL